jgi:hypothetical protein
LSLFHHHQLVEYGEGRGWRERPRQRPVSVTFSPRRGENLPPSKNEIESSVGLLFFFCFSLKKKKENSAESFFTVQAASHQAQINKQIALRAQSPPLSLSLKSLDTGLSFFSSSLVLLAFCEEEVERDTDHHLPHN